ncbi:MAG: nitroreductase family protein [Gammaproteobacteria bacterium]|nr:nitroreductase family protein [Gammaproteobacteria bacterium]
MSEVATILEQEPVITMNLEEAMQNRRSVHYFETNGPAITNSQWKKLFELTALSPSSFNFQPWDFIIVDDHKAKEEMHPLCWGQQQILDCSAVVAVLGDKNPHRRDAEILQQFKDNGYIDETTREAYMGAVDVVYPDEGRKIEHAAGGSSLAAMSFMLAAHGMNLATLPIIGFDHDAIVKYLDVPDDYIVTMLIAVGHSANKDLPRQQRRDFTDIVHWGKMNGKQ